MSGWRILIPVKQLSMAKARTGLEPDQRRHLAVAMLRDVLSVVHRTPEVEDVLICTSDPHLRYELPEEKVQSTSGHGGLNADLHETLRTLSRDDPGKATGVVVADLPCMTSSDFATVLRIAATKRSAFVSSQDGGTTILAVSDPQRLVARFGEGSARLHGRCYQDVSHNVSIGCRLDIDTLEALLLGHSVGLGTYTQEYVMTSLRGLPRLTKHREFQLHSGGRHEYWRA